MPANCRGALRRCVVAEAVGTDRLVGIDTTPELRRTLAYERLASRPGSGAERVGWSNGTQRSSVRFTYHGTASVMVAPVPVRLPEGFLAH